MADIEGPGTEATTGFSFGDVWKKLTGGIPKSGGTAGAAPVTGSRVYDALVKNQPNVQEGSGFAKIVKALTGGGKPANPNAAATGVIDSVKAKANETVGAARTAISDAQEKARILAEKTAAGAYIGTIEQQAPAAVEDRTPKVINRDQPQAGDSQLAAAERAAAEAGRNMAATGTSTPAVATTTSAAPAETVAAETTVPAAAVPEASTPKAAEVAPVASAPAVPVASADDDTPSLAVATAAPEAPRVGRFSADTYAAARKQIGKPGPAKGLDQAFTAAKQQDSRAAAVTQGVVRDINKELERHATLNIGSPS